jgi:hypothetical protein
VQPADGRAVAVGTTHAEPAQLPHTEVAIPLHLSPAPFRAIARALTNPGERHVAVPGPAGGRCDLFCLSLDVPWGHASGFSSSVVALNKQTARGEGRGAQILMSRVCCRKNCGCWTGRLYHTSLRIAPRRVREPV